jgi:hypothetical protein
VLEAPSLQQPLPDLDSLEIGCKHPPPTDAL